MTTDAADAAFEAHFERLHAARVLAQEATPPVSPEVAQARIDAAERRAAYQAAGGWECLSGVFGDRLDAAGYCVCCGYDPFLDL